MPDPYTKEEPERDTSKDKPVVRWDTIVDFLKENPDRYDALIEAVEDESDLISPTTPEEQQNYIDGFRNEVEVMNDREFEMIGERPYHLATFRGQLSNPESGDPICVICDMRRGDLNVIGEKLHAGFVPTMSGIFQEFLIKYGESDILFREIPTAAFYDVLADSWEDYMLYSDEDIEIDSPGEGDNK